MSKSGQEYYRIHENDTDEMDSDPGYEEWSNLIDLQDLRQQDAEMKDLDGVVIIDLSNKSWSEVMAFLK